MITATAPVTTEGPLRLGQHGTRTALVLADGTPLTHADLAERSAARAAAWGPGRRLVLVEGGNTLDALVAHLAAVEHGHVSLLVPDGRAEERAAMIAAYEPDVVCARVGDEVRHGSPAHRLHPDLALLLSTSGSTGSPKLVRLSHTNVASNAAAIADYLALTPDDRAVTSLPLHYCYGLSVVHSHLAAGGSLALTEDSVVDRSFWDLARASGATNLAGVPYTFDLLERSGFTGTDLPRLRLLTQAGGRMAPAAVRRWAAVGAEAGWDLVVMYGQTEATARIAWLPPGLAATRPDAIGLPVPGGRLRVDPVPESDEPGVGELVYSGPNVMMGYATAPADLARGAELSELRTGDLGREREGLFEVVGRRNHFAKLFGLRLDLELVERRLEENGSPAHLVATEARLHAFVPHGRRERAVTSRTADFCGIPASAVRVHVVPDLPRTDSGKVDTAALTRLAQLHEAALEPATGRSAESVLDLVARLLGRPDATPADSFVSLGGDSLSFVEVSLALEERVATLPGDWHTMALGDLEDLRELEALGAPTRARGGPSRRSRVHVDTGVALRAVAIVMIVASHVDLVSWEGGAHLLLAMAGYNFARFQLGSSVRTARLRHGAASLLQLVLPSALWVGAVAVVTDHWNAWTALFLNGVLGHGTWDDQWQLWFLESLAWVSIAALALVAIPAVHRAERRWPFGVAMVLLAAAAALRFAMVGVEAGSSERYTTSVVAFFFVLGWAAARATGVRSRLLVSAVAAALVVGFFGDPWREAVVLGGFALVLWVPRWRLPIPGARHVRSILAVLASSSLFIYLTQWQVYPPLEDAGHPWLALAAALAVGIATAYAVRPLQRWIAAWVGPRPSARASAHVDPVTAG